MATVNTVMSQLDPHQNRISKGEAESILARWEFGRVLRSHILEGKKHLPSGLRAEITNHYKLNPSEITARMKLAEKFTTQKQVADACASCGNSWRRIIAEKLPKTPRKEKADPPWNEGAKAALVWWQSVAARTPERRQEWAALLRDALREAEADIAVAGADGVEVAA